MIFNSIELYSSFERSGQDIEIVLTGNGNQSMHPEFCLFLDRAFRLGYKSIVLDARNTNTFYGIKKLALYVKNNPEVLSVLSLYHDSDRIIRAIQHLIPGIQTKEKIEYERKICEFADKSVTIRSTGEMFACPLNRNKDIKLQSNAFIDPTMAYLYRTDIELRQNLASGQGQESCQRFCNGNIH